MQKIKRITGIVLLCICGLMAIIEIIFIRVLMDEQNPQKYYLIAGGIIIVLAAAIIFFMARLGLKLIDSTSKNDPIDQIGK